MKTLYVKLTFVILLLFVGSFWGQVALSPVCKCFPYIVYGNSVMNASAPIIENTTCTIILSQTDLLSGNCYSYMKDSTIVCEGNCQWRWKAIYECITTFDSISPPIVFKDSARGTYITPCSNTPSPPPSHHKQEKEASTKGIKNKQVDNFNLFPNPIRQGEELTVILPTASKNDRMVKVKIYTIEGKVVSDTSFPAPGSFLKIKFPHVNEGNYIITI